MAGGRCGADGRLRPAEDEVNMQKLPASLTAFQESVARVLSGLAVLHVPALILIAWLRDMNVLATAAIAILFAATPLLLMLLKRPLIVVSFALAVALIGQTAQLVYLMTGHPWQIEMHFYYFAVLALIGGFCGRRTIVFAASLIAAQHLLFNWLIPEALYPGGSDFMRVMVHAVIVVIETAMLCYIGFAIREAFGQAERSREAAEAAAAKAREMAGSRQNLLSDTTLRADRTGELLQRFESEMAASIEGLHATASALLGSADKLGTSAAKSTAQIIAVSSVSESTARRVEQVAQAGEELTRTIDEVGASAAQSSQLAASAVAEAQKTSATVDEMASVVREIGDVTGLISGIAAQTNLLALNATIEAARAGEAGRGFSVVAQEVKALANQTARATQEIAVRIAAMQDTSARSVSAIQTISSRIHELDGVTATIAVAVEEQAAATRDIAGNVASAATGVGHVEAAVATIETLIGENRSAVGDLNAAADALVKQTQTIRERVKLFTGDIERLRA